MFGKGVDLNSFFRNRGGVSAILGTVMVLGILLIGSFAVWFTISEFTQEVSEEISLGRVSLDLEIVEVSDELNNDLGVSVQRKKGERELTGIKFIVEGGDQQEIINVNASLSEFDVQDFVLSLQEIDSSLVKSVSIVPIFSFGVGEIKDVWTSSGDCFAGCPDLSEVCVGIVPLDTCGGNSCSLEGTLQPDCAQASMVSCGEAIPDAPNGCGACEGLGTLCSDNDICIEGVCIDPLSIGLLAYFNFNDGSANDLVGDNHASLMNGAALLDEPGRGKVLALDGVDDLAELTNSGDLDDTDEFSISLWLKLDNAPAGGTPSVLVILKEDSFDFGLYFAALWRYTFPFQIFGSSLSFNWEHYVLTYDGEVAKVYREGVLFRESSWVGGSANNDNLVMFGCSETICSDFFEGKIDEIRFYNRSVSEGEVSLLYSIQ